MSGTRSVSPTRSEVPAEVRARGEDVAQGEGHADEDEEGHRVKHRRTDAEPTEKEVEEHSVDHATFRSWCPHCVKGKAAPRGHRMRQDKELGIPRISID